MISLNYSVDGGVFRFPTELGVELRLKNVQRDRSGHIVADARFVTPEGAILALSHGDLESGGWRRDFAGQAATRNSGNTVQFENVVIEALVALEKDPAIASQVKQPCEPKLIPASQFIKSTPPARPSLVEGLYETGTLQAVVAKPKVAKSLLVLELAITVSSGGGLWLGRKVTGGRAALFQLEDSPRTISNRILKMACGRVLDQLLVHQNDLPFQISEDNYHLVADACRGCSLVVVDPIIQASNVSDWNAAAEVRAAYELWRHLARELDAVVVIIAHHRKLVGDFGEQIAGSIQGLATPDGIIEIRRDGNLTKSQRKVSYVGRDWSDLEEQIIDLDPETLCFKVVGSASDLLEQRRRNATEERTRKLKDLLPKVPPGLTIAELCEKTKWTEKQTRGALKPLRDSNTAVTVGKARSKKNPMRFYCKGHE